LFVCLFVVQLVDGSLEFQNYKNRKMLISFSLKMLYLLTLMCVVSCLDGLLNMTLFGKESYFICTAKCGNVRFGLFSFADNYVMCIGLLLNY
jgi:hypothetical protein